MHKVAALLLLERPQGTVPLARTHDPVVVRRVAEAALLELEAAHTRERDTTMAALLAQEVTRVRQGLETLGLAQAG